MPKAKPYSGPVDEELVRQVLNSTGQQVSLGGETLLLGDALFRAARHLRDLVRQSNEEIEGNEFAKIVAEHLAAKMNRRGNAEIAITERGEPELYISYEEHPAKEVTKPTRQRRVPLLEELKDRAQRMGVDISEFGIKRKKIQQYLDDIESGDIKPKKAPKSKKKKGVATVQTANDPPESDPGPMSAGPDETRVSPPLDDPKPPKRGFVKTAEAVAGPVVVSDDAPKEEKPKSGKAAKPAKSKDEEGVAPNMRQLVKDAKDVSIADLLTSDPPK